MTVGYDTTKTLEQLEKNCWGAPTYSSYLVKTCHDLRKKPLKDFETEDLRIMIGQNIGLDHLIPLALIILGENILAEGDMFEGDLLSNVLKSDKEYWTKNKENWKVVISIMDKENTKLNEFDTVNSIKKEWFTSLAEFKTYN